MDYLQAKGKKYVISGVANERSIAWAVAQKLSEAGAHLCFLYAERMEKWVSKLCDPLPNSFKVPFDAGSDESTDAAFAAIREKWGTMDGMLHSIAYASAEALGAGFIDCSREDFLLAQNISAYSLLSMSRRARTLMENGGSIVALSFIGSTRAMGQYHVMGVAKASLESTARYLAQDLGPQGIRVNVVSPGPIKTLSARGVSGFSDMAKKYYDQCTLKDAAIDSEDAADAALFFLSDRSKKITGELLFVDSGYNMIGNA